MNPFDMVFCWQAVLVSLVAFGLTQLIKTVIDLQIGHVHRKNSKALTRLVLPMVPIWIGATIVVMIPLRPEELTLYVERYASDWRGHFIYAFWGGGCGMFSDYAFTKIKAWFKHTAVQDEMGAPVER